ncbi:Hypothetical_protein [Hexamita inflata]|uniref:Hypothetical_protein n=1 Tax=Hexamita inflata TaxID=28002 RepID=A0AA86Q7X1_9EUKA|nr:Hypothetical protein HINF_LOCUS35452 [Hexamita inflata]
MVQITYMKMQQDIYFNTYLSTCTSTNYDPYIQRRFDYIRSLEKYKNKDQLMISNRVLFRDGNLRVHKIPNQITPSNSPIKSANQISLQIILSNFSQSTQSQATAARCWLREFFSLIGVIYKR